MTTRSTRRGRRRAVRTTAVAAAAVVAFGAAPATTAMAAPDTDSGTSSSTDSGTAAGLTPLLRILEFGDAVGAPLACNLVAGLITTGAGQVHMVPVVSPLVTQVINACTALSDKGDEYLQAAISRSEAMTFINPILNPVIKAMEAGTQAVGADHADTVAPFGPTIAGLGGTIAFFEGE